MSLIFHTATGALTPVPFQGEILFGAAPEMALGCDELRMLQERFDDQIGVLLPYIQRHHSHVYVPLSEPEEGYHASFSGQFTLEDMRPFFRKTPNALTVVDGRPWGFLRVRLMAVSGDLKCERVAEIEVLSAQESAEAGFELFWAEPEHESPHQIRVYDRRPGEGQQAIGGLVNRWADRIRQTQILTREEKAALLAAT